VFLSGGAFTASAGEFRQRVPNLFLDKPCSQAVLRATVAERLRELHSDLDSEQKKGIQR